LTHAPFAELQRLRSLITARLSTNFPLPLRHIQRTCFSDTTTNTASIDSVSQVVSIRAHRDILNSKPPPTPLGAVN